MKGVPLWDRNGRANGPGQAALRMMGQGYGYEAVAVRLSVPADAVRAFVADLGPQRLAMLYTGRAS